jgi:hypothetical protein
MVLKKIGKFYYLLSGSEATLGHGTNDHNAVDSCNDISGTITIPESVSDSGNEYTVTKIAYRAFFCCKLTGVVLPNTIRIIEFGAFDLCYMTEPVNFPESLISVDSWAFSTNRFTSLRITKNIQSLGCGAFHYNNNLVSISVDPQNKHFRCDSQGILYDYNYKTLILTPNLASDVFVIPKTVTRVNYVSINYAKITKIIFPPSVKFIEDTVLLGCLNLKTIIVQGNPRFSNGNIASDKYDSFIYCGTKEVKNTIFNSNVPNSIVACSGYKGNLLGQKTFTTNIDCYAYPIKQTCRMSNYKRKTFQFLFVILIS